MDKTQTTTHEGWQKIVDELLVFRTRHFLNGDDELAAQCSEAIALIEACYENRI